jgi:hypothetical protein
MKSQNRLTITLFMMMLIGMFVMALPATAQENCEVTSINGAVLRSGPSIDDERRSALPAGDTSPVVDAQLGILGFVWWQLDNGAWVREDLVTESAGCDVLSAPLLESDEITCTVTGLVGGGNLRAEPSDDADLIASIAEGETRTVFNSQDDANGQMWWQLTNGTWIRADLVSESEGCTNFDTNPDFEPVYADDNTCVVTGLEGGGILRAEPNSESAQDGVIGAGQAFIALETQADLNGQNWWRLSNGRWVREDLVSESSACNDLLEFTETEIVADANTCVVTGLEGGAVLRTGAGSDFESAGALGFGESRIATRAQDDINGQQWWRLSNGRWVRADLVSESEACATIGETGDTNAAPIADEDTCVVTGLPGGGILRSQANSDGDNMGQFGEGQQRIALEGQRDLNGQVWWRLNNDTWIREDLVTESEACANLIDG